MLMTGSTVFHGISTALEIILYPLSNWQQGPSETTEKENPVEASEVEVTFSNVCPLYNERYLFKIYFFSWTAMLCPARYVALSKI